VVLGLWFFSGFLGAFLGSCLKLRGSIVFSCKANVSQCGSDLHRYYAQKKKSAYVRLPRDIGRGA
jgi:hypothetical protein